MERRLNLLRSRNVGNYWLYNALSDVELLPVIAVFFDEATSILENNYLIHDMLADIIVQLRKAGIFLFLAGQEMNARSMRPMIRRQLSSRFAFHAADAYQVQGLGMGKEVVDLNTKGRAWTILPGRNKILLQTPYVDAAEIEQLLAQSGRLTINKEENND